MPPIQTDGATETGALSQDDAANAFLADFLPDQDADGSKKKNPSSNGENEEDEQSSSETESEAEEQEQESSDESPEDESDGDEADGEDEDDKKKSYVDNDETYVKVKVGDKEHEVPVKDLKRLWGQETALNTRSQEVAEQRKTAEAETTKAMTGLKLMLDRATAKAESFRGIDWMALAKSPDISAEEASALRAQAQEAFEEENFFKNELGNFVAAAQTKMQTSIAQQARECIKALSEKGTEEKPNPHYIEGWGDKVYDDLRAFGMGQGLHQDMINNLTDPAAFKILHMAMQFHRGAKKVQTTKVNKAPKKIVKTSNSPAVVAQSKTAAKQAIERQRANGNLDNTTAAFLSTLTKPSDD
jgi:hypothetical protein